MQDPKCSYTFEIVEEHWKAMSHYMQHITGTVTQVFVFTLFRNIFSRIFCLATENIMDTRLALKFQFKRRGIEFFDGAVVASLFDKTC